MKNVITGNEAAAMGAVLARAQVVPAYPITPQTTIIESLAKHISQGHLQAKYIPVESEHSAMAGCIGASTAGARAFTATSSQGLLLMHELLHWAAGARLPIVMVNVNRAVAPGWSIWSDQNDSLSQRDTGWLQFYCENNQEVVDTVIQAYKIAETISLPCMVILDAFVLSHTSEIVDIPETAQVDSFLPPYRPQYTLDVDHPVAFGGLLTPDVYMEFRYKMQEAMNSAVDVIRTVDAEWAALTGRRYGLIETYRTEDAEAVLVTSATAVSTARTVIDTMRDEGLAVGLVKVRVFRPFPTQALREVLSGIPRVAVLDRNISFGHHGIFCEELKSALYANSASKAPRITGYIAGLGGRDITPKTIRTILTKTLKKSRKREEVQWVELKT